MKRISGKDSHNPAITGDHGEFTGSDVPQADGNNKRGLDVSVINDGPFGDYDTILVTYPTTLTEVYTYSLSAVDIGTITVTYTDLAKKILSSVVKSTILI